MTVKLYQWRNSYRFIAGFEFLRDYLRMTDVYLVVGWGNAVGNGTWREKLAFWTDLNRRLKLEVYDGKPRRAFN